MIVSANRARARRERAQALARQDILEAALRAFAKKGYADTKMTDIAAEAGYTAASLYTYFPGKKELFHAAALHFVELAKESFGEAPERPAETFEELAEWVKVRVRAMCAFGDQRHEVLGFFMRIRWSGEPVVAELRAQGGTGCALALVDDANGVKDGEDGEGGEACEDSAVRSEQKLDEHFAGLWRALGVERFGVDPVVIAGVLGACIESFFARKYLFGQGGTLSEDADGIAGLLLYGIRGMR